MAAPHRSFLGTGWSFPPRFSRQSLGVEMVSEEEDIRESLIILLGTSPGERLMVPTYGCELQGLVFHALTRTLATEIEAAVSRAILEWEPRISVLSVTARADAEALGIITISVDYVVRLTNTRSNLVYPFSTGEATLSPRGP